MKKVLVLLASMMVLYGVAACDSNKQADNNSSNTASNNTATQPNTAASPKAAGAVSKVEVAETEMAIKLTPNTVPQGPVDFVVRNEGKVGHEMVLFKTDVPLDKLPTKGGKLDEGSKSLKKITEVEEDNLKSGANKTVRVPLSKGKYVVICNVGKHFEKGMKAALTVQ